MSNAHAVSAVTAVLRTLLVNAVAENDLASVVGTVTVSAIPPDRISLHGQADPNQLNLFLYQTVSNAGWSNLGYPGRSSDGARTGSQPLAINLRYLLTAYGSDPYFAEILLGHGMQTFHENAVVPRDFIQRTLNPTVPVPGLPAALGSSGLAEQIEQIKITPEAVNTEEMSRLWSALQARYRPTAVYQVAVVLIESAKPFKPALPVDGRLVKGDTYEPVVVEEVGTADGSQVTPGSTLVIRGRGFRRGDSRVRLADAELTPALADVKATEIRVTIADPPPAGVRAGVIGVEVFNLVQLGKPLVAHAGALSNAVPLVFHPKATFARQGITTDVVDGVTVAKGAIRLTLNPKVTRTQRVAALLNEFQPPANRAARGYAFAAPPGNGLAPDALDTGQVDVPIEGVIPGQYVARARVDGADSLLEFAAGAYSGPLVTV